MNKIETLIEKLCPNGVEYKAFGKMVNIVRGASPRPIKNFITLDENGVNWIKIGDVKPGSKYITETVEKITQEGAKKSRFVKEGDFILSNSMSFGRPYILKTRGCIHDGWLAISDIEKYFNSDFLYHLLSSNKYQQIMRQKASFGGAVQNLNADIVRELEMPVIPLKIQNEIVKILDNFTEINIEVKKELNKELEARQKQYEYYRNELITKCNAREGKLIELLSQPITDGPHTTPELFSTGVPFVSATAVYDGKVHLEDAKGFISKEFDIECSKKYKPKKNDVFMVKSGSTTGKVAYVDFDEDFNIWSPLAAMRTDNEITSRYLYHLLQTTEIQNQVLERMSHGSQPNLSMRVLEQFDVRIPDIKEQEKVINILDILDDKYKNILQEIALEIEARQKQYEYYRDKLLTFKELKV